MQRLSRFFQIRRNRRSRLSTRNSEFSKVQPGPKAPHVLIIVQNLPVPLDRRVWLECTTLVSSGYDVSVICPKGPGDPSYQEIEGIRTFKYAPPPQATGLITYAFEFAYCWIRTAWLTLRAGRGKRFDAIQACNPPDTFWLLARFYKRSGVKFIFDQHDLCPEIYASRGKDGPDPRVHKALLWLERQTYQTADHVIATNKSYREMALTRGGCSPGNITIVRSGPDVLQMKRSETEPELRRGARYLCTYLGIMGYQDRVDVVIRAADYLINREGRTDIHFALLGFGDTLEANKRLAESYGLSPYVTFTGRADLTTITRYLSTTDVGLAPDPKTAFNDKSTHNKVLEYMAFEVPVVSFDLTESMYSAAEAGRFVQGAGNVDDGEIASFADAIVELLDDAPRRALMGVIGRQRIESELGWHVSEANYLAVYDQLLRPHIVADTTANHSFATAAR